MRTPVKHLATIAKRHVTRGPVARAGIASVVGVLGAAIARTIGLGVIAPGAVGSVVDAAWIGVAAAITCQVVLAGVAIRAPDTWRATRRG